MIVEERLDKLIFVHGLFQREPTGLSLCRIMRANISPSESTEVTMLEYTIDSKHGTMGYEPKWP
jgi:hypothetical protein